MPIFTDESQAPEAVIKMSLYKCKTSCSTMAYKRKNSLVCTEMCLSTGLENVPVSEDVENPTAHDQDGEDGIEFGMKWNLKWKDGMEFKMKCANRLHRMSETQIYYQWELGFSNQHSRTQILIGKMFDGLPCYQRMCWFCRI